MTRPTLTVIKKAAKELDKANDELEKGDEERAKGKFDKAIDKYKKAWEHAIKAAKRPKNKDDDSDDDKQALRPNLPSASNTPRTNPGRNPPPAGGPRKPSG